VSHFQGLYVTLNVYVTRSVCVSVCVSSLCMCMSISVCVSNLESRSTACWAENLGVQGIQSTAYVPLVMGCGWKVVRVGPLKNGTPGRGPTA